jgi:hypothetical protein
LLNPGFILFAPEGAEMGLKRPEKCMRSFISLFSRHVRTYSKGFLPLDKAFSLTYTMPG